MANRTTGSICKGYKEDPQYNIINGPNAPPFKPLGGVCGGRIYHLSGKGGTLWNTTVMADQDKQGHCPSILYDSDLLRMCASILDSREYSVEFEL